MSNPIQQTMATAEAPCDLTQVVKVRQRQNFDCGVACLAMAADIDYVAARAVFDAVGLATKHRARPYLSNHKDLRAAMRMAGVASNLKRFEGWHSVGSAAILRVPTQRKRLGHWVFAGRDPVLGLFVHDPATTLPTFEVLPQDVLCHDIASYQPTGFFIDITAGNRHDGLC